MEKTVLVVDDDKSVLDFWRALGQQEGISVIGESTIFQALRWFEMDHVKLDGVISDWNLDPQVRRGGPYAIQVIATALDRRIPTWVRTGTDDSTGRLARLQQRYSDSGLLRVESKIDDNFKLRGFPQELLDH